MTERNPNDPDWVETAKSEISGMAKEGILKPHPHTGRGNAYTIV